MNVTLDPDRDAWLRARITNGDVLSVEAAAGRLPSERISEPTEDADLAWAMLYVDEGSAAFERGEFITLEQHQARKAARRAQRRG